MPHAAALQRDLDARPMRGQLRVQAHAVATHLQAHDRLDGRPVQPRGRPRVPAPPAPAHVGWLRVHVARHHVGLDFIRRPPLFTGRAVSRAEHLEHAPGLVALAECGVGHQRPHAGVRVLAAVFTHAGWVGLDVAGARHRVRQRRVEQPHQPGLAVDEQLLCRGHGLALACQRRGARQHRPGLRDQVDAALGVVPRAECRAIVEEGARVPRAVPRRAFQRIAPAARCREPARGPGSVAAPLRDGCELGCQPAQEPRQPHRFAPPFDADAVHAVVPVAAAHQGQAVHADGQAVVDGARAVFVERGALVARLCDVVGVFGAWRHGLAREEGHHLVEHGRVASGVDVVDSGMAQPEQVVGEMGANASPGRRMPPVLHIAFGELARRRQQQLAAQHGRRHHRERHGVLQLIPKTERATGLVEAGAAPQAAGDRLVQQPPVHERIEQGVGRAHRHAAEQLVPLHLCGLSPLRRRQRDRLARQRHGGIDTGRVADQPGAGSDAARRQRQRRGERRAGVEAGAAALAEVIGHGQAAARIEQLTAVAGPLRARVGRAHADTLLQQHRKGGGTAEAGEPVALCGGQQRQALGCVSAAQRHPRRCHREPVDAAATHHPFGDADHAQAQRLRAAVAQGHAHLLDGARHVNAPRHLHLQVTGAVANAGDALAVFDAVLGGRSTGARRGVPDLARAQVLQQQQFAGRVGHRIVRPGGELMHAAVAGPGVTGAGFRHLRAEVGVRQHVDPRPHGPGLGAHVEAEPCAIRAEVALRCDGVGPMRGRRQRGDGKLHALVQRGVVPLGQFGGVLCERPAIGIQLHARQCLERAALRSRQLGRAQHDQHTRPRRWQRRIGLGLEPLGNRAQFALQRHQVRRRLDIQQHQVARQAAPGPEFQRLHHRSHQTGGVRRARLDEHDGAVARDAEAPQHAPVERCPLGRDNRHGARHQQRQRGRDELDGGEVGRTGAHLAQADAGERGRHGRRAFDDRRLAVLVDQRFQFTAGARRRRGEAEVHRAVRRKPHPQRERRHRVEARDEFDRGIDQRGVCARCGERQRVVVGQRVRSVALSAEPARAVGLDLHAEHLGVGLGHEVHRMQALLGGQARVALEVEGALGRVPFGAHEQLGKRGVGFVGAGVGHRHLERGHQVELDLVIAEIAQLDLAQFEVVFRAHPHRAMRVQVAPLCIEADAVDVEGGVVVRGRVRCRVLGKGDGRGENRRDRHLRRNRPEERTEAGRHRRHAAPKVEERAMRIAQRVVAPARDEGIAETAPARAVGAQRHAVATVREQVRRLQCRGARHDLAPQAGAGLAAVGTARPGRRLEQHRHLARHALLQQRRHGLQARLGHRPAARCSPEQHVGQRQDRHALVVRHEGVDGGERGLRGDALGRVVERLDEARRTARMQCLQAPQVGRRSRRVEQRGQCGRVRGHDQFVGRRAAQREHRHALRRVLVGQRVIARRVGRFRDAPGHMPALGERLLRLQGRLRRTGQHAGVGFVEQQRRHQVLEHRARP